MKCLVKFKHLSILLLLFVFFSGCNFGSLPGDNDNGSPDNPQYGSLAGTVYDAGLIDAQLQFGQVEIDGHLVEIKDGTYEIDYIKNGTYTMKVTQKWYKPREMQVIVQGATVKDVAMTPDLSFAELDLFARLVHAESNAEPYQGQVAVAAVILNRILDSRYPNTISGVVNEVVVINGIRYYQFEPVLNGRINLPAGKQAKNASRHALAGWDPTRGATGFFAHNIVPQWNSSGRHWVWQQWDADPFKIRIGGHSFFR